VQVLWADEFVEVSVGALSDCQRFLRLLKSLLGLPETSWLLEAAWEDLKRLLGCQMLLGKGRRDFWIFRGFHSKAREEHPLNTSFV
jgi:hypothetical protein